MIEIIGLTLAVVGVIFAFDAPRRSFIDFFRENISTEYLVEAIENIDVEEKISDYLISYYQKAGQLPDGTLLYNNST